MATFEQIGLVLQIVANIHGLIRDMRDNANGYKSQVTSREVAAVSENMVGDSVQYLRRIGWITDLAIRNPAKFDAALAVLNLTRADAIGLRDLLQGIANHTRVASLTTEAQIIGEADYILANVPNYERLW